MDEKAKILIVEDERIIPLETRYKLESMGYDVPAIASSGEDAIRKARELSPDLILMDIILQGEMDGVEAANHIHTHCDIPVVYVTENISDSTLEDITRLEPFGCLFKPFEDMELKTVVNIALHRHKMEKSLRKCKAKLDRETNFSNTLIQASPAFFIAINADGKIIMMNESMLSALGYTADEVADKDYIRSFVPGEDHDRLYGVFNTLIKNHQSPPLTKNRILTRDGRILLVEWQGRSIFDEEGTFEYFFGMGVDVTNRKKTEEALWKSEERYRTIIESMEDGYYEVDLAGRFTFFNEAMRRIIGFSTDELVGRSNLEYTSPKTAKKLFQTFNRVFQTGKPADVEDYEVFRKDGDKRVLEFNVSLIRNEKGEPVGFRGIARDVTRRKEMERELERRFQYLEGVLEAAPSAIVALDRYHRVLRWNPGAEKLFGYSQEEVIGRELDSLVAAGSAETMNEAKEATQTIQSGKSLSPWETVRFRKDGSPVHVTAGGAVILIDSQLIGGVAVYNDISARKRAEEEIRAHQEHLALINQILRHDITNDLVVIQSAINLYRKSPEDELLKEAFSHAEKSIKLIQRMEGLETFISAHRELKMIDLGAVIDEIIKHYDFIDFTIQGKARVMADDSVRSVLDNIVRNAVIHGKADRIAIDITEERDMCDVRIADNGIGIPDDLKNMIFEEGFIHGDTGHTGIGLHVVQKAMQGYGGYAWAEDNKPQGAVFVLRFRRVK